MEAEKKSKQRKLKLTLLAITGITSGIVYAFIHGDGTVMLASLIALGAVTGLYNLANAWQARAFAENGKATYDSEDEGQGRGV